MGLMVIDDYSTGAHDQAEQYRIKGFEVRSDLIAGAVASQTEEKLGTVANLVVNDAGLIQYIVVDLGLAPSGRQVLLPADKARVDASHQRVYATGITKDQAEQLPGFNPADLV